MKTKEERRQRKAERKRKPHFIRHSFGMIVGVLLLVAAIIIPQIAAPFGGMIQAFVGEMDIDTTEEKTKDILEQGKKLSKDIEREGAVLLKNENKTLPLSKDLGKVNVFGWASTQWLGGGSGSGQVTSTDETFLSALEEYGIEYNKELETMYQNFCSEREYKNALASWPKDFSRLYEPDINDGNYYTKELLENAKNYSDTAIVVIGRQTGESNDNPQKQYKINKKDGEVIVDESRTSLDLSTEEEALLTYAGANFEHVIVLLNTGNVMTLGAVDTIEGIDACLLAGYTGQYAGAVLPEILWGEVNPSGHTADTWAYDFSTAASYANAGENGVGSYSNGEGFYPYNGTRNGNLGEEFQYDQVSYVDYAEGIYVGYKWYETADTEGYWNQVDNDYGKGYEGVVQYPFGYGLSYTTFEWELLDHSIQIDKDGDVSAKVKVTNTGDKAGKDVVELYYATPYLKGEIEKSAVELGDYAKTKLLEPGESEEVTLTISAEDMASYDAYDSNQNGFTGYELDEGTYTFSIRTDSHTVKEQFDIVLNKNIQYAEDGTTGNTVSNKFTGKDAIDGVSLDGSDSDADIKFLTRADFEGTFPKENKKTREMTENVKKLNLYTDEMANEWINKEDKAITTGEKNHLKIEENGEITDLGIQLGSDYDDPKWEEVLNQLTIEEMQTAVNYAYVNTGAFESIGKPISLDFDGPNQVGSFTQGMNAAGTGFANATVLAQTWNKELAFNQGLQMGQEGGEFGYGGLYGPSVNIHRSPFNGRNYEYFSEDAVLSGMMSGNEVNGITSAGMYSYIKHFICNDGESGIYRDSVYLWMPEQALREVYLKPFRMLVEDYGATGLMTSYNRIGAVWAGGSEALLTGILRDEWGFKGTVVTDFSDHPEFMNGGQMLRAGGDIWMNMMNPINGETESASYQQALRKSAKHIIYTYLNARVTNLNYVKETGDESLLKPTIVKQTNLLKKIVKVFYVVAAVLILWMAYALWRDVQKRRVLKAEGYYEKKKMEKLNKKKKDKMHDRQY